MNVLDITLSDTILMLKANNATLIDVRNQSEWDQIGVLDVSGHIKFLSLLMDESSEVDPNFLTKLKDFNIAVSTKLIFICKSGRRSAYAADMAAGLGYKCYNIPSGIENARLTNKTKN